jgi:hypothetical protein
VHVTVDDSWMAGWRAVVAAGATARPQAPPSRCQRLWSLQRGRGRLTLGASGYGRDGGMWAPLPWRHRQQERQQGRGHLPPGASGSVAAGTTSGPAALYYAPAAAAMATTPPLPPPRLGDTPHAPPCPPMPPPSPCPTAGVGTEAPGGWDGHGCLPPPPGGTPGTGANNSSCSMHLSQQAAMTANPAAP